MNKKYCVVTTVNPPTKAIEKLYEHFGENLIIVGDEKTPKDWNYKDITPLEFGELDYAPNNHYARKNAGYIVAIGSGAELIYDTDDDNCPNDVWHVRNNKIEAFQSAGEGWFNVYDILSDEFIWPRGFSLKKLYSSAKFEKINKFHSSIQQGLSDGEPDVDAIWRLTKSMPHEFSKVQSIYINKNTWCPFNSQSTWWFPKAFPLMYLPIHATFRMTDIWRSFVAQKCLWAIGEGVTFHSPSEVYQDRNEHDLLKDFEDEIPGYLNNDRIVELLGCLELKQGEEFVCENLQTCYEVLIENKILPIEEMYSVREWVKDYKSILK